MIIINAALMAFVGGLILNLMPCVFPVLSIKALSLIKIAAKAPHRAKLYGLSYTAGVIFSFLSIAGLLIALQAGGSAIGWGFQLQNPTVIALLAYLFFIIGLNLSGEFEITNHFGGVGNRLTKGDGLTSAFFVGVLATIVATPCTAPFMGVAIGVALTQPAIICLIIFAMLGLGLAMPYLALSFIPSLQRVLPKPGKWMITFRKVLAFPMYASSAWLVWVLSQQVNSLSVLLVLLGMVILAAAFWLVQYNGKMRFVAIIMAVIALAFIPITNTVPRPVATLGTPFSPTALENDLSSDRPVFIEMTAAWCITCKVNNKIAIDTNRTREALRRENAIYIVGDWTNKDSEITAYLKSFGRSGVPLYIFYGARDLKTGIRPEPVVLPQILTPNTIAKTVMKKR